MTKQVTALTVFLLASPYHVEAASIKLECHFDRACIRGNDCELASFELTFFYDDVTKDALVVGNNGNALLQALPGEEAVTFLEPLSSGAVQTTTVTRDRLAVHSRHTVIAGGLVPSQYVGSCLLGE